MADEGADFDPVRYPGFTGRAPVTELLRSPTLHHPRLAGALAAIDRWLCRLMIPIEARGACGGVEMTLAQFNAGTWRAGRKWVATPAQQRIAKFNRIISRMASRARFAAYHYGRTK